MKIRIKFRKYGVMKFIGHLDIMRYFQKAMRRADIDICYSEGFSPHQIMSFAAPLGVGITSDGEYLDIEVHSTRSTAESLAALNAVMVEGVEVTGYVKLPDDAKTAMSIVAAADYELFFKEGYEIPVSAKYCAAEERSVGQGSVEQGSVGQGSVEQGSVEQFREGLAAFFEKPEEVLITKKPKKSEKVRDLMKLVYDIKVNEVSSGASAGAASGTPALRAQRPCFYLLLSTGSTDNLKPELALEALFEFMGIDYNPNAVQIHRKDVYARKERGGLISRGEMAMENP